jgi:CRP-like cAMP-binding protein
MTDQDRQQAERAEMRRLQECLQATDFLHRLKLPELEKLMSAMKKIHYPAGYVVFRQGDPGDTFYLVSQGRLSLWVRKMLSEKKVADLHPMDYFGEAALLSSSPRSATVKAETDCDLFVLKKDDFQSTLMANPGIAQAIQAHRTMRSQAKK